MIIQPDFDRRSARSGDFFDFPCRFPCFLVRRRRNPHGIGGSESSPGRPEFPASDGKKGFAGKGDSSNKSVTEGEIERKNIYQDFARIPKMRRKSLLRLMKTNSGRIVTAHALS